MAVNKNVLKSQLSSVLASMDQLKKTLNVLESDIYRSEEMYLEDTTDIGNIVKGFDPCSRPARETLLSFSEKRVRSPRKSIRASDRIFSNSSVTWQPSTEDDEETESDSDKESDDEDSQSTEETVAPLKRPAPAKRLRTRISQDG